MSDDNLPAGFESGLPFGVELEYKSLRDEILTRIRLRQQLLVITLTASGAFLGFGLNNDTRIALVYPPLAMFLAIGWSQNDRRIRNMASYIRHNIENRFTTPGWELSIREKGALWRFLVLSHGGTFLFTQILAIGVGLSKFGKTPIEYFLLTAGVIAFLAVLGVLGKSLE